MARDLVNSIAVESTIVPAAYDADQNGTAVDLQGFESASIVASLGAEGVTLSGTTKIDIKLEDSDDGSTFAAVTGENSVIEGSVDASGIFFTADADAEIPAVATIGYRGGKRYVRAVADFSGTHGTATPLGVNVIKGHPRSTTDS